MLISIHAPIVGCDLCCLTVVFMKWIFQSTHPSWGATFSSSRLLNGMAYFNPRTHRGVRPQGKEFINHKDGFQSTHPSWGATKENDGRKWWKDYFNPRTHRGVRPKYKTIELIESRISIHAPIVGCDIKQIINLKKVRKFQSTHPSWGATLDGVRSECEEIDFNPRTHRGVRHKKYDQNGYESEISIHAPIVGCDYTVFCC